MGSVSQHNTHGPINWFSQSLPLVTGGGSTDGVSSPSLIFSKCIRNYHFVNTFLKFLFHHPMNYLRCSLFNYSTTLSKNFNHKKQKTVTFFSDGWYCFKVALVWLYTISPSTHSQLLFVNVSQRLICVYSTLIIIIYINKLPKTSILFYFFHALILLTTTTYI